MSVISRKKEALKDYEIAQNITSALRDISALELGTIREEFERGKTYYEEIEDLYKLIKLYMVRQKLHLKKEITKTKNNVLVVAMTSNKRFYGSLNNDVMRRFLKLIDEEKNYAFYVVGQTGEQYVRNTSYEPRCTFFKFKEDELTANDTITFVDTTRRFDHVLMLYPKFINVFRQNITVTDITYVPETQKKEEKHIEYIFEPELDEIFWFFDTQVRYILFNQVMLEIKLSRTAARLVRMNKSEQNAREAIQKTNIEMRKILGSFQNMRLLETFSGMQKWKTF